MQQQTQKRPELEQKQEQKQQVESLAAATLVELSDDQLKNVAGAACQGTGLDIKCSFR